MDKGLKYWVLVVDEGIVYRRRLDTKVPIQVDKLLSRDAGG